LFLYFTAKYPIIYTFSVSLISFGFIVSILIKELGFSHKYEYYFYYNFGITKMKLLAVSGLLNGVFCLCVILGYAYAK
jgi:hypothetical protein